MQRQREAKPLEFTVRDLTRDDLARLEQKRTNIGIPERFRDPHHRVARLVASGLRLTEVAHRSGYSYGRVTMLINSPAFQELVALYREKVLEAFVNEQEDFIEVATSNMMKAQRMIAEQLDEADEEGTRVPLNRLLAISADAADRVGYGKRQTNVNLNADFAKALEKAYAEQARVIESRALPPARAGQAPQTVPSAPALAPTGPANRSSNAGPFLSVARPAPSPVRQPLPRDPGAGVTVERGAGTIVRRV